MRQELRETLQLAQKQEGRTVLVVDDEPLIRDLCAKALKGCRVLEAENGEEALRILARQRVDVVLTDVMMPLLNGLDLLSQIKEREPGQVVVIMTGYAEKEVVLKALKADADDFLTKPINLLQLRTTLDRALEKKALREELIHLKKMDRLKSDFLGLVSHKLKTPVTAISLFMQNLARGIGDPKDPAFRHHLELILQESTYLEHLIEDLLQQSQVVLQAAPPRLEQTDPAPLLRRTIQGLQQTAESRGVALEAELPKSLPALPLDASGISFALGALIDNALKFSPPGSTVRVSAETKGESLTVVVRDQGPGIPPGELTKVFEKFYQVDPAHTGQVRGFGLGLYYARHFIQTHHGELRLESAPGAGTLATVTLPL